MYSLSTLWTFNCVESKHYVYSGEGYMEMSFQSLRKHAIKIISFRHKNMNHIWKKKLSHLKKDKSNTLMIKNTVELEIVVVMHINT